MDILTHVKVKCVPGGLRSESRMVEGEVCSLQLTHKSMAHSIVKEAEAEYVKNVIGKLLDLKPSWILVEKSITH